SRRRHTRSKRDWSSDVCSSDLGSSNVWLNNRNFNSRTRQSFNQRNLRQQSDAKSSGNEPFYRIDIFTFKRYAWLKTKLPASLHDKISHHIAFWIQNKRLHAQLVQPQRLLL